MATGNVLKRAQPCMLSVLRIVAALLFLQHGTSKLFGFPMAGHEPALFSLLGVQGLLEFFGGLLILLGLWTRPVAFLLSGDMAVAYFLVHFPGSFFPILSGGDLAVLFCFVFLYLFIAGGGAWSFDAWLRRTPPPEI